MSQTIVEQIKEAISAHGMWKQRIRAAIATGEIVDTTVETIRVDNQCAFGKWLYGDALSAQDKQNEYYKTVKLLHAEFHLIAAEVVSLALAGKKAEAEVIMRFSGEYAAVSAKLTQSMMAWKASLPVESPILKSNAQ